MEYVIDPNDPLITPIKERGQFIETKLDKGMILTEILNDISDETKKDIHKNNYVAVEIGFDKKLLFKYTKEEAGEIISSLQTILKELFSQVYQTPIEYVNATERESSYIFTPYTKLEKAVFVNSKYLVSIPIEKFIGYTLLSTSTLTRYLIEKWITDQEYLFSDLGIKYYFTNEGYISLIPLFSKNSKEIIYRVETNLVRMIKDGYFAYTFGIHDLEDWEIVRELLNLYNISIIDSRDFSTLICQSDVDFKTTPIEWIRYNLPIIKSGEFPIFSINLDFSFSDDYARLYGWYYKDVILKYASYLAYARLADSHPVIRSSINSIHINDDLTVNVSLPSYFLVKLLKQYILEYLNDGISYSGEKIDGKWNLEICKNLNEAIIKRWIVQQVDSDAYPMVFKSHSEEEVLIHRSPLAIKFPSRFNFDINSEKEILLKAMREYYTSNKVCHDGIEPVVLEEIKQMNLDDLLTLIPVEEQGKTYCFLESTVSQLVKKENPLTRRPFSEKTIMTQKYLELGLRGLFDVGVLFGLFPSVPTKYNVEVDIGKIRVTREYVVENRRDLVGNIFLVEVIFPDETTSPLFEISLPMIELERIKELRDYVEKLWPTGYFLNPWNSYIYKSLDKRSFPILMTNPVLLHASDSIYDGNIALEMLRNAAN